MNFLEKDDPRRLVWKRAESPIEQMLCVGLFAWLGVRAVPGQYDLNRRAELAELAGDESAAFAFAQHYIGRFRVDYLLVLVDPKQRRARHVVIECDGAAFHEAEQDEERDKQIRDMGYKNILRFSGKEIHQDYLWIMRSLMDELMRFGVEPKVPTDCGDFHFLLRNCSGLDLRPRPDFEKERVETEIAEMLRDDAKWL